MNNGLEKTILASFGANVLRKRLDLNLTQNELADRAGIHRSQVVRVEAGDANPTLKTIIHLCSALETNIQDLIQCGRQTMKAQKNNLEPGIDEIIDELVSFERKVNSNGQLEFSHKIVSPTEFRKRLRSVINELQELKIKASNS